MSYQRVTNPQEPITVYMEGDGYAWASTDQLSADPTPLQPIGLELAARDPAPNVVYVARPCQYTGPNAENCTSDYWTDKRFAPEVIDIYDALLTQLKIQTPAQPFYLIGFSGGGAIALLVAERRNDIASIRTVAGNLDTAFWASFQGVSPLTGSLNPADKADNLSAIPQLHFVGTNDPIMPPVIAQHYSQRQTNRRCIHIEEIANATHQSGWVTQWPVLLKMPVNCDSF